MLLESCPESPNEFKMTMRVFRTTGEKRCGFDFRESRDVEPAISTSGESGLRHIKMQIFIPRCMGARAQGFRLPATFFTEAPGGLFFAQKIPRHTPLRFVRCFSTERRFLANLLLMIVRWPASRENLICERARRTKSVIRLGKDEKI